jgi:hypothetical protein
MVVVKYQRYYVLVGDEEDTVTVCDYVYLKCHYIRCTIQTQHMVRTINNQIL